MSETAVAYLIILFTKSNSHMMFKFIDLDTHIYSD